MPEEIHRPFWKSWFLIRSHSASIAVWHLIYSALSAATRLRTGICPGSCWVQIWQIWAPGSGRETPSYYLPTTACNKLEEKGGLLTICPMLVHEKEFKNLRIILFLQLKTTKSISISIGWIIIITNLFTFLGDLCNQWWPLSILYYIAHHAWCTWPADS